MCWTSGKAPRRTFARPSARPNFRSGLYDAALGPTDYDSICPTCGLGFNECPGHCGHIELPVPVYNPILFPHMYKLLRMKCMACHHFRLGAHRTRIFRVKLLLCDVGNVVRALSLDDELLAAASDGAGGSEGAERLLGDIEADCLARLGQHAAVTSRRARVSAGAVVAEGGDETLDQEVYVPLPAARASHVREARLDLIAAFLKAMPATCAHCGASALGMRKDGVHKIWLKTPPKRIAAAHAAKGIRILSALSRMRNIAAQADAAGAAEAASAARKAAAAVVSDADGDVSLADIKAAYADPVLEEEEDLFGAVVVPAAPGSVASGSTAQAASATALDEDGSQVPDVEDEEEEDDEVDELLGGGGGAGQSKARPRAASASSASSATVATVAPSERYLHPAEVEAQIQLLWMHEGPICRLIWAPNTTPRVLRAPAGWRVFFTRTVLVTPNRFRPPTSLGDLTFEHPHNAHLTTVLNSSLALQGRKMGDITSAAGQPTATLPGLGNVYNIWGQLQDGVCGLLDQAKAASVETARNPGIRQLLERKEGLFRKNMMGKRVNFAARSVISPDPYIRPDQVGVPVVFAKTLTYPTPVTPWNVDALRQAVINGPGTHPGANFVEDEAGNMIDLARRSKEQREVIARTLLTPTAGGPLSHFALAQQSGAAGAGFTAAAAAGSSGDAQRAHLTASAWAQNPGDTDMEESAWDGADSAASANGDAATTPSAVSVPGAGGSSSLSTSFGWRGVGKRVWRHLQDGDVVLMNRQPTLHKPSIMAHVVRVLRTPTHRTIRMHYANCKTYNADFDGDEMNMHFPQSELARAEAYTIAGTSQQYVVPTTGKPIRGLIQDHVGVGVLLTKTDTFLTRDQYQQFVYAGALGLPDFCTVDMQGSALLATRSGGAGASAGLSLGLLGTGGAIARRIPLDPPAILKPTPMWTGKQVISTLLKALTWDIPAPGNALSVVSKTQVPAKAWAEGARGARAPKPADAAAAAWAAGPLSSVTEATLRIHNNDMVTGVLDKASLGNATYGVVHSAYELFGADRASALLSALGRLLTVLLQDVGLTCSMDDLVLMHGADVRRRELVNQAYFDGNAAGAAWARVPSPAPLPALPAGEPADIVPGATSVDTSGHRRSGPGTAAAAAALGAAHIAGDAGLPSGAFLPGAEASAAWTAATRQGVAARMLGTDAKAAAAAAGKGSADAWKGVDLMAAALDGAVKGAVSTGHSAILDSCLPHGLYKPFPENSFSLMVTSGAKGSRVNHAMITCGLGQQELEGRRVPLMVSGKSLPAFPAFHPHPRAGGFVADRFLTGLRPQEYYFHCMSGREGLVDTAVKTSRSGYLQRCLVKHLEDLRVAYDFTVRDSEGSVYQFLYGEDGMDVTKAAFLPPVGGQDQLGFLASNAPALSHAFTSAGSSADGKPWWTSCDMQTAVAAQERVARGRAAWQAAHRGEAPPAGDRKGLAMHEYEVGDDVSLRRLAPGLPSYSKALSKAPELPSGGRDTSGILGQTWVPGHISAVNRDKHGAITSYDVQYTESRAGSDDAPPATVLQRKVTPCVKGTWVLRPVVEDPVVSTLPMTGKYLGLLPEAAQDAVDAYSAKLAAAQEAADQGKGVAPPLPVAGFNSLMWLKALKCTADPGEPVGVLAAQSVGEPSTQMTLNTFHLAGSGGVNVTLGIPRLREIVMTASQSIKTPSMMLPVAKAATLQHILATRRAAGSDLQAAPSKGEVDAAATALATRVANTLRRVSLSDVVDYTATPPLPSWAASHGREEEGGGLAVAERLAPRAGQVGRFAEWERQYTVTLQCVPQVHIAQAYNLDFDTVAKRAGQTFVPLLLAAVDKQVRRAAGRASDDGPDVGHVPAAGAGHAEEEAVPATAPATAGGGGDSDDEAEGGDADGTSRRGVKGEVRGYDGETGAPAGSSNDAADVEGDEEEGGSPSPDAEEDGEGTDAVLDTTAAPAAANAMCKPGVPTRIAVGAAAARSPMFASFEACAPASVDAGGWLRVTLSFPAGARKVLMLAAAETALKTALLAHTPGIKKGMPGKARMAAPPGDLEHGPLGRVQSLQGMDVGDWAPEYYSPKREQPLAVTEGVNFPAVWAAGAGILDMARLSTNDIGAVLRHYGVEAARAAIVREVKGVFGVYGIKVDPRHLGLIADYMTFSGGFKPMNRLGMRAAPSPYQQMSFETTTQFLTQAALYAASGAESLASPSAALVVGQPAAVGTGGVEVLHSLTH